MAIGIYGIIQDVTEKKKDEKTIRDERILLRTMIDNIPVRMYTKDSQLRKTLSNRADYEYLGAKTEEAVLGKDDSYFFPDDTASESMQEDTQIFNTGQPIISKEVFRKQIGGGGVWFLISKVPLRNDVNEIVGLVGISHDITEKKAEELRLKLFESVITNTEEAVVITEAEPIVPPGPKIEFVNDAYTRMTGFTSEEAIGQTPRITQNAKTNRKELDRVAIARKNWQPFDMTVLNSTKSGKEFWVNVRATPIADEKGWFTHWVAIQRDVTKEIEAEAEKEKLLDELVQNNKELTQFSYITTHNLRAPLTNLVTICKKIDIKFIEDRQTVKLIEGFKQSTMLLNDTLNDLIKILIIKENRNIAITELVFEDILGKVKTSISNILLKNVVKIEADFSEAITVSFVGVYLESIFLNLLTNAIKYAHPTRYPLIKIKTYKDADGSTKLTFSDNGIGMDMERVKGRIFGLYKRFHSNKDGKGIGLYLVHSQITTLGGKIEVESEEGVGTTFTITFK